MLSVPGRAPNVSLRDWRGNTVRVGDGRPTLLAFFRSATCPFCNMYLYQLQRRYEEFEAMGLQVIAVFASSPEDVKRFVMTRPRPFTVCAEPDEAAYDIYGLNRSIGLKFLTVLIRMDMWLKGMAVLGLAGTLRGLGGINTNNIMPADFLIDENGQIVQAHYGRDAGDHITFERIESFLYQCLAEKRVAERRKKHRKATTATPSVSFR